MKMAKAYNVHVDGIDRRDGTFCDAYILHAEHEDGTSLSEYELDALNEDKDFVYDCVINTIYYPRSV
jgi:hypothetical protein